MVIRKRRVKLNKDKVHAELSDVVDKGWKGNVNLQRDGPKQMTLWAGKRCDITARLHLENPSFQLDNGSYYLIQD